MIEENETSSRKSIWIPREAWRQEGAVRWVKSAVLQPHLFVGFDRSERKGDSHLWEQRRGARKGFPDTVLWLKDRVLLFEFKAGNRKPDDDQKAVMQRLSDLGHEAAWGYTIDDLYRFYLARNVPMATNAEFQALHHDGLVDSRIAKAEARQGATPKRARRPAPRFLAGKKLARRMFAGEV